MTSSSPPTKQEPVQAILADVLVPTLRLPFTATHICVTMLVMGGIIGGDLSNRAIVAEWAVLCSSPLDRRC